jgi:hypothetical protein
MISNGSCCVLLLPAFIMFMQFTILSAVTPILVLTSFRKFCRKRLFVLINELPTVFDTVTGKKAPKGDKHDAKSNKSKNNTKVSGSKARHIATVFKKLILGNILGMLILSSCTASKLLTEGKFTMKKEAQKSL